MKIILSTILFSLFAIHSFGQFQLEVEADAMGMDRDILLVNNKNNSNLSSAGLVVQSGIDFNESTAQVSVWSLGYTASPGYAGYAGLSNTTSGVVLRASNPSGDIRFLSGGGSIALNTRMFINPVGNVGIGTDNPNSKLEISSGQLFVNFPGKGIILKSANRTCAEISIDNTGNLISNVSTCPN